MAMPALNTLTATLAGATVFGLVVTSQPAKAALLTYDFTVNVTSGSHSGNYTGNFSFDASAPVYLCDSAQGFYCADPVNNSLKVVFNFLGKTYTEMNDHDYSDYPRAYFQLNPNNQYVLNGLSFLVLPPTAPEGFFILGGVFELGNQPGADPYDAPVVGDVSYAIRIPKPPPAPQPCQVTNTCNTAVPEPSEIAGSVLGLGILGLGLGFRRRAQRSNNFER